MIIVSPYNAPFDEDLELTPFANDSVLFSPLLRARDNASPCSVRSDDSQVTVTPSNWRALRERTASVLNAALQEPVQLRLSDRHRMQSVSAGLCAVRRLENPKQAAKSAIRDALRADWPSIDLGSSAARTFCDRFATFDRDVRTERISASTWRRVGQMRQQLGDWGEELRFEAYQQQWPWFSGLMKSSLGAYLPESSAKVLSQLVVTQVIDRINEERRSGWTNDAYESELYNETVETLAHVINQTPSRYTDFVASALKPSFALDQLYALGNDAAEFDHTADLFFSYQRQLDHGQYVKLRRHFFEEQV